jgi:hypothetical protein
MSATLALFERWMAHKTFKSESAALRALGLTPGAAQHWKAGRNGSIEVVEKMCKDLGEDYVLVVMQAFQETASSEPEKKLWKKVAKRVGGAAVLALMLSTPVPDATAATGRNNVPAYTLCAVRGRGRSRRRLRSRARITAHRAA